MDSKEAKLVLQARRPNGRDDAQPLFAEALALVARDPELRTWWEAQQAFDQAVTAKLNGVGLPPDLRATILAGRKIEQLTPRFQLPYWLAAAAVIALLAVVGSMLPHGSNTMRSGEYEASVLPFLGNDNPSLALISPDHGKVAEWLKERNSPMGHLPANMADMPSVGCQKFMVEGHAVSLICFSLASGGIVHLFVVNRGAIADPPGEAGPEFKKIGNWSTAAWSDDSHSYMLATQAGPDALKKLL